MGTSTTRRPSQSPSATAPTGDGRTITLTIDGDELTPQALSAKVLRFVSFLRSVDQEITSEDDASAHTHSVRWVIDSVRSGSLPVYVTFKPVPVNGFVNAGIRVVEAAERGIRQVVSDQELSEPPPYFSVPVLEELDELRRPTHDGVQTITVVPDQGEAIALPARGDANIKRFIRPKYEVLGTITGRVEVLSSHRGLQIQIRDRLTGHAVKCEVAEGQESDAIGAFRQLVVASGWLLKNVRGQTVSIRVNEVRRLAPASDLPPTHEFAGSLDITGGLKVEEFLKRLNDAS